MPLNKTQSIDSRAPPRRTESNVSQTQPAIKVVGFRVEGAASPSPPSTLLSDSQRNDHNGSPNPVIIPPSFQTDSPIASRRKTTSADQPALGRQKTAPVFVPGSLPGDGHVEDASILVSGAAHRTNPRDSSSPPRALTIHTSVSLPPVGSDSPIRWELEEAKKQALGPSQAAAERPLGQLSISSSPRQLDTPTFGRSHVPASPFASAQADHSQEHPGGERRKSDTDRHSDTKPGSTRSIPNSPHGTPRAASRQASFSHHNVLPIASTVAAAAASLGVSATPHATGGHPPDLRRRSLEQADRTAADLAASSSLYSSTQPRSPGSSPQKPDLEMPPPPMQPVHQSASAAELAAQAREAEQQESATATPIAGVSPSQQPTAGKLDKAHADKASANEAANKASAKDAVKAAAKEVSGKAAAKETSGKAPVREASTAAGTSKEHKAPAKQGSRVQQELRQEKPKKESAQPVKEGQDVEKPKTTRAERRAKQEAERAAKEAGLVKGGSGAKQAHDKQTSAKQGHDKLAGSNQSSSQAQGSSQAQQGAGSKAKPSKQASKIPPQQKGLADKQAPDPVSLPSDMFAHLQQYKKVTLDSVMARSDLSSTVHPAVLQLGLKYAEGSITGANARCIAMLDMLRSLVQDYETPAGKVLSRDLTQQLNTAIQFLVHCRPLSISMGNAIKYLKLQVSKIDPATRESDAKQELVEKIDTYIQEKIVFADNVLVTNAVAKVYDEDVILTYSFSSVVFNVLLRARKEGKRFRVVVMDSRPHLEGRALLRRLLEHGIACSYVLLNAASYIMQEVTKVFLGASAVLSNGTVMSRAGSAAVAMMAYASSKPVLICCETYKFHEKVQLDSITANELGDPEALIEVANRPEITALQDWQEQPRLGLLNLTYDAMPSEYVTLVVTEFGAIPPTSVPVILREYRQEPTI